MIQSTFTMRTLRGLLKAVVCTCLAFTGLGCSGLVGLPKVDHVSLYQPTTEELDRLEQLVSRTVQRFSRQRPDLRKSIDCLSTADRLRTLLRLQELLEHVQSGKIDPADMLKKFSAHDTSVAQGTPLFTGYYEPLVRGSLKRSAKYAFPLYRLPAGALRRLSRRQIDSELKLQGKHLELVWLDSPVDRFFLQIQGSGKVLLDDGRILNIGYAGKNGHPYRALGSVLLKRKLLAPGTVSMQSIRALLDDLPDSGLELMNENPSYVYFDWREQGATGTAGVELEGWLSFASDPRYVPLGSLALVKLENDNAWHLMLALDTGGAIKGANRFDIFTGFGEKAGEQAGMMQSSGDLYVLRWPSSEECKMFLP